MNKTDFIISSDDCSLVSAIYKQGSLRAAADFLCLDIAGISRRAKRISQEHEVLAKVNGKWILTDKGLGLIQWFDQSIKAQKDALQIKQQLKIASTSWFCEQFIFPNLPKLSNQNLTKNKIAILTPLKSFEKSLLDREVDIVISCHPPNNPAVMHKKIANEEWVTVIPNKWKRKIIKENSPVGLLSSMPFIRHSSVNYNILYSNADKLIGQNEITVNQLTSLRSAVVNGLGWSSCPKVLVQEQINSKKVIQIDLPINTDNKLCIWWLRERRDIKKQALDIMAWVKEYY